MLLSLLSPCMESQAVTSIACLCFFFSVWIFIVFNNHPPKKWHRPSDWPLYLISESWEQLTPVVITICVQTALATDFCLAHSRYTPTLRMRTAMLSLLCLACYRLSVSKDEQKDLRPRAWNRLGCGSPGYSLESFSPSSSSLCSRA